MRIWIDADRVPNSAREIAARAGERLDVDVNSVSFDEQASMTRADVQGLLRENVEAGDLLITGDDAVGRELAGRGVVAVHPRGEQFEPPPVGGTQGTGDLLASIRSLTPGGHGPTPYDERAKRRFAATLDRILAGLA